MKVANKIHKILIRVPAQMYLAIAVLIFAASNSVTKKIVEIGQSHAIDGRNPISLCNVLFVGNICALGLMTLIFHQDWQPHTLKALSRKDWISLTITGILSGAIIGAIATVVGKLQLQSIPLGIFTIYRNILGTVIFFLLANLLYGLNHFVEVLSPMIVYAAVIVVTGQLCWLAGLKNATATELNLASLFNPIAAIIMAYFILGEAPTLAQYLGGSLLLVGMILGFVGNLNQAKINRQLVNSSLREAMSTAIGFRGV
jgi:drug/metabolite transporter (DMT)-like permease